MVVLQVEPTRTDLRDSFLNQALLIFSPSLGCCQVVQDDGSMLSCALNAACAALIDAGIPMTTMLGRPAQLSNVDIPMTKIILLSFGNLNLKPHYWIALLVCLSPLTARFTVPYSFCDLCDSTRIGSPSRSIK